MKIIGIKDGQINSMNNSEHFDLYIKMYVEMFIEAFIMLNVQHAMTKF